MGGEENRAVGAEFARVRKAGGRFCGDTVSRDHALARLVPEERRSCGNKEYRIRRWWNADTSRMEKEIEVRKLDTCTKCDGKGAEAGSRASNCPTCNGRGQVISSRGCFQVSQTCTRWRGCGQIIEKRWERFDGEGRGEKASGMK